MNLLEEAKNSNKQAYNELISKYNHIFYKTARVYFLLDKDVYTVLETSLSQAFRELINVKTEKDFLFLAEKILIKNCENLKQAYSKDIDRKINSKQLSLNIGDKITSTETIVGSEEYKTYRKSSIVEEYITSIEEDCRLIALLYYYADFSISEISVLLKIPKSTITQKVDKIRIKIYEMIKNKEVDLYNE